MIALAWFSFTVFEKRPFHHICWNSNVTCVPQKSKKMRTLLVFLGVVVVAVTANVAGRNICNEETEDGNFVEVCCEGYSGLEEGCVRPVCQPECEENGGICVSPNVCSDCPEGRSGENCERSPCQQERENHRLLSRHERRQRDPPTCLPDGTYTILQCSEISRMCHCADRWTGEPYVSTYTYGVPDCRKYYIDEQPLFSPKEVLPMPGASNELLELPAPSDISVAEPTAIEEPVAPCKAALDEWKSRTLRYFFSKPDCDDDGFYTNNRCDFIFGYCICVDRYTGVDIEESRVFTPTIDCTQVTAPEPTPEVEPEPVPEKTGCTMGEIYYEQDQSFYRDCNVCTCHGYNVIQCTTRTCNPDVCYLGETDKVVGHNVNGECHRCLCDNGVFECSVIDCGQLSNPVEVDNVQLCEGGKPPNIRFYDECNYCGCSSGSAWCTQKGCRGEFQGEDPSTYCYVNGVYLRDGQNYRKGCDKVRCVGGQLEVIRSCAESMTDLVLTRVKPSVACKYNGEKFYNGESMILGTSLCKCQFFDWTCQTIAEMK